MDTVISKDGTTIGYDKTGSGPTLVLLPRATGVRAHPMSTELVSHLEPHVTVHSYDRRGRTPGVQRR